MVKGRPVIVAGLDIGTSKTAVIIAANNNGRPELMGAAVNPSVGLHKGVITDIGSAAKSIGQVLEKAEKMAGVQATCAYVSYNGAGITVRNCRVTRSVGIAVCGKKKGSVSNSAGLTVTGIPEGEKVLCLIPRRIMPDILGVVPEADAKAITAGYRDITGVIESVRLTGLEAREVIYGPLAGAGVLLSPAERELGTYLIDIGAGVTSISIFDRGAIRETAVLPLGGEQLIGDLAIGMRTSLAGAEEMLKNYSPSIQNDKDVKSFTSTSGQEGECQEERGVLLKSIIEARITELFELVAKSIDGFDYPGLLPGGAVLYGGVSRLNGLAHLAESELQIPVRVGSAKAPEVPYPACDNALGLVKYGCAELSRSFENRQAYGGFVNGFLKWFQNRF